MTRIAFLASPVTLPGSPTRRSDAHEHDLEVAAIAAGLAPFGATLEPVSWDARTDWSCFDAVMIGTTWDYWDRVDAYLAALDRIHAATRLFNPPDLVRWNLHKGYLKTLKARGAPTIPTVWLDEATPERVEVAYDALETRDLVLKRQIGAGAAGQVRVRRGELPPRLPHPMMAQAFIPAIVEEGEYSFICIDGTLSHALIKRARPGDYRIQSMYGGVEQAVTPTPEDRAAAEAVLALLDAPPLYARVDMVRGADGGLMLMELEVIEPYLYPEQGPNLGAMLASALMRRIRA